MSSDETYNPQLRCWVPSIPEPFWVRHWLFWDRPGCYTCRIKFRNRDEWEAHYKLIHLREEAKYNAR